MERWSRLLGLSSTRLRNACRFALTARRTCLTFVSVAILFELFLPSFLFADEATLTETYGLDYEDSLVLEGGGLAE